MQQTQVPKVRVETSEHLCKKSGIKVAMSASRNEAFCMSASSQDITHALQATVHEPVPLVESITTTGQHHVLKILS
jgi:ribosomal protein L9